MLRKLTTSEKIALALDAYARTIRDAFLAAIAEIKSTITLSLVISRIDAHDVEGAIRALNIEAPVFNPMLDEVAKAYTGGGSGTIGDLPALRDPEGFRLVLRFDARNPIAEAWLRDNSATMVREIVADQMNAVRAALVSGTARGLSGRQIALDLVGRGGPGGQRLGGIIGLTSSQAEWVDAYRNELQSLDKGALTRNLRDRRFDKSVLKAIADDKPIPQATIDKMVTAYENRALRFRGEMIGRTESLTAFNAGADESMRQQIDAGKVSQALVDGTWRTTMDGRERDSHAAMDGQVQPFGQPFISGLGNRIRYPGDPLVEAADRVQCRCSRTFTIRKEPRPTLQ